MSSRADATMIHGKGVSGPCRYAVGNKKSYRSDLIETLKIINAMVSIAYSINSVISVSFFLSLMKVEEIKKRTPK